MLSLIAIASLSLGASFASDSSGPPLNDDVGITITSCHLDHSFDATVINVETRLTYDADCILISRANELEAKIEDSAKCLRFPYPDYWRGASWNKNMQSVSSLSRSKRPSFLYFDDHPHLT